MNSCQHIAIIMDGNGRYAKSKGLPRFYGHLKGSENLRTIAIKANEMGIKVLTVYAFSTENWKRPLEEVDYLMKLPKKFFDSYMKELMEKEIKIQVIGDLSQFPQETKDIMESSIELSKNNSKMILNFALNYGSQQEIVQAASKIVEIVKNDPNKEVTNDLFETCLQTYGLPDVDLMIRTSGEQRLSNFLLYQLAYAEMIFIDKAWPEFNGADLEKCINDFNLRNRRFGGL
ncbi:MAG: isoprenyl transferase [Erysipelotrichaceae bacterium]